MHRRTLVPLTWLRFPFRVAVGRADHASKWFAGYACHVVWLDAGPIAAGPRARDGRSPSRAPAPGAGAAGDDRREQGVPVMTERRMIGRRLAVMVLALGLEAGGCAHRRPVIAPADSGAVPVGSRPGVHVRAPFVDVQVHEAPAAFLPELQD